MDLVSQAGWGCVLSQTWHTCASRSFRSGFMIPTKSKTSIALATSEITQQLQTEIRQRMR